MTVLFYVSSALAVLAALAVVTRTNAMHALIGLLVLFISMAGAFFSLGAPFAAVLQVVIYAGAIMVLFVFVVMILNLGHETERRERGWLKGSMWVIPGLLGVGLIGVIVVALAGGGAEPVRVVGPKMVGISLYRTYLVGVEIASILLLAGLVAAYHYGAFFIRKEEDDE